MENFPRFLESWGSANVFTYNGSMVKMFPSLYSTNVWGQTNVYKSPGAKLDLRQQLQHSDETSAIDSQPPGGLPRPVGHAGSQPNQRSLTAGKAR